jgi:hypothetical protein
MQCTVYAAAIQVASRRVNRDALPWLEASVGILIKLESAIIAQVVLLEYLRASFA